MKSFHQHVSLFPLLAEALNRLLIGYALKDAYRNQSSTELTMIFGKGNETLSLQLNIEAKTGLFFFYEYPLERSGAVFPLYKNLAGSEIVSIQSHDNNRSFQIDFGSDQILVFKMYGPLTNVIYFENNQVKQLFRAGIENDFHLTLHDFYRDIPQEQIPENKGAFYIIKEKTETGEIVLSYQKQEGICLFETEDIFEALHTFSKLFLQQFKFQTQYKHILGIHRQKLKREEALYKAAETFLHQAQEAVPFDETGHIIMANLHQIPKGATEAELFDFYRSQPIVIPLKKDLSAQDNAAYYYQKFKNRKKEIILKEKQIELTATHILDLKKTIQKIESATDLNSLKPWIKEEKVNENHSLKEKFRRFESNGFQIYVGKNAANNDSLTLKFAHKEDLWLHAKGVSGSHVVIKHKPQQNFPQQVIEFAARIAAHYSSSAGSEWVPVIYTLKKYVRKPKGAHAGQVAVEREDLIMVKPGIPD